MASRWGLLSLLAFVACHSPAAPPADASLEGLTAQLVELDKTYWALGGDSETAEQLVAIAAQRAPLWDAAVKSDPTRALANVVPSEIAVALPDDAVGLVEHAYDHEAEVTATVADDFVHGVATYALAFDAGATQLYPVAGVKRPKNGTRYHAVGYERAGTVLVTQASSEQEALAGIEWTTGETALGVLINFTDMNINYSTSSVLDAFAGASSYDSTVSNGTTTLTATAVGPLNVDIAHTCDFASIETATYRALAAAGYDENAYSHLVAFFNPSAGCAFTGQSEIGQATNGRATFTIVNDTNALTHELGHAHGLYHPHSMSCPGSDLAADESTCTTVEYGHPTDIMAHGAGSFDAFGLENVEYLGRPGFGTATIATTSGSYTIYPITSSVTNTRLVKVPYQVSSVSGSSGWTRYFYLEYHTASGLEAYLAATNQAQKVMVNVAVEGDGNSGYYLKSLGVGDTFTAPNGTLVTVTAVDDTSATFNLTMPAQSTSGCTRAAPLLVAASEGVEQSTTGGATTQYQISLWDRDSAACGYSRWSISSADLPSGWTMQADDVVGYGTAVPNALVYVTSAAGATGTYNFTLTATDTNGAVTGHDGSYTVTHTITSCTPTEPTITMTPATGMTLAAGGTANYLFTLTNNNSSSCGDMSTSLNLVGPSTWVMTPDSQSFTTASGATSAQNVTLASPAGATGNNLAVVFVRYLVNNRYYTKLVSAQANIGSTCVHSPALVKVSPALQTSVTGGELDYTVTVKNLDGPNCASTAPNTISLAVAPPTGVTATLDMSSFSLAQGATGTTTLRVTATTSTIGDYVSTLTATNASTTSTATATYRLSCGSTTAPKVTVSPSTQSGQPGDTLSYSVTVKNQDTGTLCGSRTYTLSSTVTNLNGTTGWTTSTDTTTMTLASGATGSTTLRVTSPSNAAAPWAVYKPTVTATDDLGNAATAGAFYNIQCLSVPVTIALSPTSTAASPGSDVPVQMTITDNDTINCPSTMTLTETLPGGWTDTTTPTQISLVGGQTTTITWTPHVKATATEGTYSPKEYIDNAGIGTTTIETVTIACPHTAPTITLTPSSQTSAAGGALDYTATVTNNDPAYCQSQTFALSDMVPSGWTDSWDSTSLTLAPGASDTATLTVTSPASAFGSSTITATATAPGSGAASATATYVVSCTHAAPTVSLSPSTQSGSAGAALAYTLTVTNHDSASCAAEAFTFTKTLPATPAGWTGAYSPTSLTLSPGASNTTTFTLTSPVAATPGDDTFTVGTTNASSGSASTTGTYTVALACAHAATTVSLSPSSQSAVAGTLESYTATVTNHDVACGTTTFAISTTGPSGWTLGTTATSVTLASGAATQVTLSATSAANATTGTYTVSVGATNGVSTAGSGSASYVVVAACVTAAPTVTLAPSSQSGTAGTQLTYTATIKNNDQSCANETFAVSAAGPSGWTVSAAQGSVTLAAGAQTTVNVTATSAAAAPATYTVSATANGTSGSNTGNASYVVTPTCTHAAPTVAVLPSSQSGAPGAIESYSVTITNNDSACASSSFALTSTVPSGWSASYSTTPVSLASGGQTTVTWMVTSTAGASSGSNPITATATSATSPAGSGTATYVVTAPVCVRGAATVVLAPTPQSGVQGATVAYTATIANHDTSCADQTFTLAHAEPAMFSGVLGMGSVTLAAGAQTTVSYDVTSSASAPTGDATVSVTATGTASAAGTGDGVYTVTQACTPHVPTVVIAPATQSAVVGSPLVYTATVTNADVGCATQTVAVAAAAPPGWTATVGSGGSASLGAGASQDFSVTVTSATGAIGDNAFTVTATGVASGMGSGMGTYAVTCSHAVPVVEITPATQSGAAGAAAMYSLKVTNASSGCADETFALASAVPSGWSGVFDHASLAIARGGNATGTWTVTSAASALPGSYTVSMTATGAQAAGAGATFTVTDGDGGGGSGSGSGSGGGGGGGGCAAGGEPSGAVWIALGWLAARRRRRTLGR